MVIIKGSKWVEEGSIRLCFKCRGIEIEMY